MKKINQLTLALIALFASALATQCFAKEQAPQEPNLKTQKTLKSALYENRSKLIKVAEKLLSPLEFEVAFESGTERAFQNRYWNNKESGLYVDLISGKPLFSSAHKFKSGTGWPSFDRSLSDEEVLEVSDLSHGMKRVEVRSKTSDIHLGHVFEDGPRKTTGRRFCINSAALRFVPLAEIKEGGYLADLKRAELLDQYKDFLGHSHKSEKKVVKRGSKPIKKTVKKNAKRAIRKRDKKRRQD